MVREEFPLLEKLLCNLKYGSLTHPSHTHPSYHLSLLRITYRKLGKGERQRERERRDKRAGAWGNTEHSQELSHFLMDTKIAVNKIRKEYSRVPHCWGSSRPFFFRLRVLANIREARRPNFPNARMGALVPGLRRVTYWIARNVRTGNVTPQCVNRKICDTSALTRSIWRWIFDRSWRATSRPHRNAFLRSLPKEDTRIAPQSVFPSLWLLVRRSAVSRTSEVCWWRERMTFSEVACFALNRERKRVDYTNCNTR